MIQVNDLVRLKHSAIRKLEKRYRRLKVNNIIYRVKLLEFQVDRKRNRYIHIAFLDKCIVGSVNFVSVGSLLLHRRDSFVPKLKVQCIDSSNMPWHNYHR